MNIHSMSVAQRLFTGFFIVISISALSSIFIYQKKLYIAENAKTITDVRTPTIVSQLEARSTLYQTLAYTRGLLLTGNMAIKKDVDASWSNFDRLRQDIDSLSKKWIVEKNRTRWSETKDLMEGIRAAQARAIDLAQNQDMPAAIAHLKAEAFPRVARVEELSSALIESQRQLMVENSKQLLGDLSMIGWLLIGSTALAAILGMFTAFGITRSVTTPLNNIIQAMEEMRAGSLDEPVRGQERKDELGVTARALEEFRLSLRRAEEVRQAETSRGAIETEKQRKKVLMTETFVAQAMEMIESLLQSSERLRNMSKSLTDTARESQARAATVASASEQASANVQTVASASEQLSASIREINQQVTGSMNIAQVAVQEAGESDKKIKDLAASVQDINAILELITNIAEQTNLLALNATIEAARAGEAGKGFAVVASEVKTLANATGKATQDISDKIIHIQDSSSRAVEAIHRVSKTIQEMNSGSSMIAAAVEEQGSATQEISRSVQEAAQGTQIVARDVGEVANAATATEDLAGQIRSAADGLASVSQKIGTNLQAFTSAINQA